MQAEKMLTQFTSLLLWMSCQSLLMVMSLSVTTKTPNSRNKVTHLNTTSFMPVKNLAKKKIIVYYYSTQNCAQYARVYFNTKNVTVSPESMITKLVALWGKIPHPPPPVIVRRLYPSFFFFVQ